MNYPSQRVGDNTACDSRVISARGVKMLKVVGYNNGVDRFVHVHELAAVPANGATPILCFPADSGRAFEGKIEMDLDACTIVFSSTWDTTTITASADASIVGVIKA